MTEIDIWEDRPSRLSYADGTLYYFAVAEDDWADRLKAQWDLLVKENKQLREAVEMSAEEIKDRLYSAWYQSGIKQGGILYSLELDRKKFGAAVECFLKRAAEWKEHKGDPEIGDVICEFGQALTDRTDYNMEEMVRILEVKK